MVRFNFNKKKLFVIAIISGVLTGVLTLNYIENVKKKLYRGLHPVRTVVPLRDMSQGEIITENDLKVVRFPGKFLHPTAVKPDEIPLIVGQRLKNPVYRDVPLLWTDIGDTRRGGRLSETLVDGERAVAVPVDAVGGVAGLIHPGDRVDILWIYSGPLPDGRAGTLVKILLQNVNVLAVGGGTDHTSFYSTVTLSLTPEEAEIVTFAVEMGKIVLALRNMKDVGVNKTDNYISMKDILGNRMKRIQEARTLRIIRGRSK